MLLVLWEQVWLECTTTRNWFTQSLLGNHLHYAENSKTGNGKGLENEVSTSLTPRTVCYMLSYDSFACMHTNNKWRPKQAIVQSVLRAFCEITRRL